MQVDTHRAFDSGSVYFIIECQGRMVPVEDLQLVLVSNERILLRKESESEEEGEGEAQKQDEAFALDET